MKLLAEGTESKWGAEIQTQSVCPVVPTLSHYDAKQHMITELKTMDVSRNLIAFEHPPSY